MKSNGHNDGCACDECFDIIARGALETMDPGWLARHGTPPGKIVEITPELERRVLAERRQSMRDHIAELEARLKGIADWIVLNPALLTSSHKKDFRVIYELAADSEIKERPEKPRGLNQPNDKKNHDGNV